MNTRKHQPNTIHSFDEYQVLGIVCWLMSASKYHRTWPYHTLHIETLPALRRGQYRLYFDNNQQPRGFVSWANLSAQGLAKVLADQTDLVDADWDAGGHTLINDLIAPWGDTKALVHHLRAEVFPAQRVLGIRRHPNGVLRKYFFFRGSAANEPLATHATPPIP